MCILRNSRICLPKSDDSSSDEQDRKTNEHRHRTTPEGRKTKVVRKSRKFRQLKSFSFNCKQASVGVQTESSDIVTVVPQQQPQLSCENRLVSTSTQTDDAIVISVSQQLRASSNVSDGLFSFGHSGLLPAIRVSDVHSDRDTDSGHMSDTENKLLSAADSTDEKLNKDTVVHKPLTTALLHHGTNELSGAAVLQDAPPPADYDSWQRNKFAAVQNETLATVSQKPLSTECGQMSRWTTATRLDILEESDEGKSGGRTFFASLEISDHQDAALDSVNVSGISVLSSQRGSNLPLLSSRLLSINSQAKSSAVVHSNVISANNSESQSSVDTPCRASKVSRQLCGKTRPPNSSNGSISRPSTGSCRRVSKGSRQSRGKPRLSVSRKSLPRRQSAAIRDKCHLSTKISRPAAWLMSATKTSRNKVQ